MRVGGKSPVFLVILKAKGVAFMELRRPDRRVKLCWTVYTLAIAVIPLIASVVLFRLPMLPSWVPKTFTALWIAALALTVTVVHPLRYRRMRYAVDNSSIISTRGVLFISHRRMPLAAVRHITAVRGPLERLTGITALVISATGGRLLLEGIPAHEADKLTQTLL